MAMVEAMVAASLLGLGLLGASRLTVTALHTAQFGREQEQAWTLAREALDCALARRAPCPEAAQVEGQGARYAVQLERMAVASGLEQISARVIWQGAGGERTLTLHTRQSAMPDWLGLSLP